ncbi:hypothetical protein K1W69_24230 [Hoeflea sp. WL0058]|uniref:Uncharacterized protein n=1 Tax=Flavimaribacter sediminis TaxID=2865987 RepID=A0AAE2ZV87_9HYPH|nr:hypothetical protein [Flavimaribacter sediminis]MBW8640322.1 hypothetical protein [Flavimaribacter sediminis]
MTLFAFTRKRSSHSGPTRNLADWLALAAAPTFAMMAWLSAVDAQEMAICASDSSFSPVNTMALMYLIMGLFHLSPWLKLAFTRTQRLDKTTIPTKGE